MPTKPAPTPPWTVDMPEFFRNHAYEDLPDRLRDRVDKQAADTPTDTEGSST